MNGSNRRIFLMQVAAGGSVLMAGTAHAQAAPLVDEKNAQAMALGGDLHQARGQAVVIRLELHALRGDPLDPAGRVRSCAGERLRRIAPGRGRVRQFLTVPPGAETCGPVITRDQRWFSVRVLPYRTLSNVIDGVVLTCSDITQIKELEARLRALIRRERRQVGGEVLKVADLVLDPASLRVTRGGVELQLSPIGLRLLTILMRESPRVVSRQEIEREIWGNGLPDSDTLRSHLYNLRKVIDKPFDHPLLHTVQSAGYRIADISGQPG